MLNAESIMSAWNTVVTIALANADQQLGIAGLNTAYSALFGSGGAGSSELSKDLSTIISALQKVQDELSEIDKNMQTILDDLTTLGFEIDAAAAVPVCAQINAYFESIQNLAQTPMKTQEDVQEFALTVLERAGPMANGVNNVFNLLAQLNQYLVVGSATEVPIIEKCASINQDKEFLSFYSVMMTTAVGYATVIQKGIATLNWLSSVNENRVAITNNALGACIGTQFPPVFSCADIQQSISGANTFFDNLVSSFTQYVTPGAQSIVQALGKKGDMAVSVDLPTYGRHGIPVRMGAYNLPGKYLTGTDTTSKQLDKQFSSADPQFYFPVTFSQPEYSSLRLFLVPTVDLSTVGQDTQVPFALVGNTNGNSDNSTTYLGILTKYYTSLSDSILMFFNAYTSKAYNYQTGYTTPPTFLLYLNSNGTFNLQAYSTGAEVGSEPSKFVLNPTKIATALKSNPGCTAYNKSPMNLGTFDAAVNRTDPNQWFYIELDNSA